MEKQIFRTRTVTQSSSSDLEGVGTLRWIGPSLFRWVRNYHTSALSTSNVVFHKDGDAANFVERVYDGLTGDLGFMAGVVVSTNDLSADSTGSAGDGGFGWIQVYGYNAAIHMFASVKAANFVIAAGDELLGTNGGTALIRAISAPSWGRHILALEALTTAKTSGGQAKKGFINCL